MTDQQNTTQSFWGDSSQSPRCNHERGHKVYNVKFRTVQGGEGRGGVRLGSKEYSSPLRPQTNTDTHTNTYTHNLGSTHGLGLPAARRHHPHVGPPAAGHVWRSVRHTRLRRVRGAMRHSPSRNGRPRNGAAWPGNTLCTTDSRARPTTGNWRGLRAVAGRGKPRDLV